MLIRIVLVDDHVLVRQGLKALIESDGSQWWERLLTGRRLFARSNRSVLISS
jgi:DNA-binding NarL/FixJ family response regulator